MPQARCTLMITSLTSLAKPTVCLTWSDAAAGAAGGVLMITRPNSTWTSAWVSGLKSARSSHSPFSRIGMGSLTDSSSTLVLGVIILVLPGRFQGAGFPWEFAGPTAYWLKSKLGRAFFCGIFFKNDQSTRGRAWTGGGGSPQGLIIHFC